MHKSGRVLVRVLSLRWCCGSRRRQARTAGSGLDDLRVERKAEPVGIDVDRPRFSWVIESSERDVEQKAYRVRLSAGHRTLWDTGLVRSDASFDVEYTGPKLTAATRYEWRVDVLTNRGSDLRGRRASAPACTPKPTGRGARGSATRARGAPPSVRRRVLDLDARGDDARSRPAEPRAFRKTLVATKTAVSAEIAITADDSYRLWVNGKELGSTTGAENEWQQARRFETALEPARNVIAVRTNNGPNSPAGLLVVIRVTLRRRHDRELHERRDVEGGQDVPGGLRAPGLRRQRLGHRGRAGRVRQRPVGPQRAHAARRRPPRAAAASATSSVSGRVRNATLFYAAGGYADFTLNGKPASDDVLSPGFTDYDDTVQYTTADLTERLKPGANALGAELGRGFYGMTGGNVWRWESPPWHDEPVVRARLRIEYTTAACRTSSPTTPGRSPTVRPCSTTSTRARPTTRGSTDAHDVGRGQRGRRAEGRARQPAPAADPRHGVAARRRDHRARAGRLRGQVPARARGLGRVRGRPGRRARRSAPSTARSCSPTGARTSPTTAASSPGFQTDRFILAGTGATERWHAALLLQGLPVHRGHGLAGRRAAAAERLHRARPCTPTSRPPARSRARAS